MTEIDELKELYKQQIPKLQKALEPYKDCNVSSPLLINPCEAYFKQNIKLMVVGQQTYGWAAGKIEIDDLLDEYNRFYFSEENKSSPFWRTVRKLEKEICFSDHCSVWTNVNRVDINGKEPCGAVACIIKKIDFMLKKEIEILKPDVIIFFCGDKFDDRILKLYPDLYIVQITNKIKANIIASYKSKELPCSIRVSHPASLNWKGKEYYDSVFSEIINNIKGGNH